MHRTPRLVEYARVQRVVTLPLISNLQELIGDSMDFLPIECDYIGQYIEIVRQDWNDAEITFKLSSFGQEIGEVFDSFPDVDTLHFIEQDAETV